MTADSGSPVTLRDVMAHDPEVDEPLAPGTGPLRDGLLIALDRQMNGPGWRIVSRGTPMFDEHQFVIARGDKQAWLVLVVECPELVEPPAGTRVVVNYGRHVDRRGTVAGRQPGFVRVKWDVGGERGVVFDTTIPNCGYTVAES